MKAYLYDNAPGDPRLPHDSGTPVPAPALAALGVLYQHLPAPAQVDALAAARGYRHRDEVVVSPAALGGGGDDAADAAAAFAARARAFFAEHLHEDEEIRYVRAGRGYFDVRDAADRWVRIALEKDDLLVLPAGIYHRFTTDENDFVHAMRLFKDEPKWTPLNRSSESDSNPLRKEYVAQYLQV